ncbi:transcriptional regulator [Acinetobacter sp. SA01]|uniref:helix-turn-helix transcriptional regulator n=1 Tax=Acinetobacter sp. SA01 TaxID=1862567 RepID=UPI001F118053|nr:transcriptional regulator [Acinetobacter sp. SA01]
MNYNIQPLRLSMNDTCKVLSISRNGLRCLISKDKTFPKAIKDGVSKQAPVYFDYNDLLQWHNQKKAS